MTIDMTIGYRRRFLSGNTQGFYTLYCSIPFDCQWSRLLSCRDHLQDCKLRLALPEVGTVWSLDSSANNARFDF